jgi:hypothetical protein
MASPRPASLPSGRARTPTSNSPGSQACRRRTRQRGSPRSASRGRRSVASTWARSAPRSRPARPSTIRYHSIVLGEAPSAAFAVRKCATAAPRRGPPGEESSAHASGATRSGAHLSGVSGAHRIVAVLLRRSATQAKNATCAAGQAATTTCCGAGLATPQRSKLERPPSGLCFPGCQVPIPETSQMPMRRTGSIKCPLGDCFSASGERV